MYYKFLSSSSSMFDRFNYERNGEGMRAEVRADHIFAPVDTYREILFKRLVYSVWSITGFYSIFYRIISAHFAFWVVFTSVIVLSPLTLIFEYFEL